MSLRDKKCLADLNKDLPIPQKRPGAQASRHRPGVRLALGAPPPLADLWLLAPPCLPQGPAGQGGPVRPWVPLAPSNLFLRHALRALGVLSALEALASPVDQLDPKTLHHSRTPFFRILLFRLLIASYTSSKAVRLV